MPPFVNSPHDLIGQVTPGPVFTTATFDMNRHYRPTENVVRRPTHKGGHGYYIIGHHELLVPLWAAATLEQLA